MIPVRLLQRGRYRLDAEGMPEKRCIRCEEWLPADRGFWYRASHQPDGLHSWCKACCDESTRRMRAKA